MKQGWRILDRTAPLLLIALFAAAVLMTLVTGISAYQSVSATAQTEYSLSTGLDYVAARVRAFDTAGGISVGEYEGQRVLCLSEQIDGVSYQTLVYCRAGSLCELFCEADAALPLDAGERLLALDELTVSLDEGCLNIACSLDGEEAERSLFLRTGEVAA